MTVTIERAADGRTRILRSAVVVPAPVEQAFAYFADPANLDASTPPWVDFRVLSPLPTAGHLASGDVLDYRIRICRIPVRWRSRIEDWAAPTSFVDHQLRGPYRHWHHLHEFEPDGPNRTIMRDIVHFRSPFASVADPLFVLPALRRIFAWREAHLRSAFTH